ncbi:hypothetical protein Tco_1443979, partial [Tanacetum coccineum]
VMNKLRNLKGTASLCATLCTPDIEKTVPYTTVVLKQADEHNIEDNDLFHVTGIDVDWDIPDEVKKRTSKNSQVFIWTAVVASTHNHYQGSKLLSAVDPRQGPKVSQVPLLCDSQGAMSYEISSNGIIYMKIQLVVVEWVIMPFTDISSIIPLSKEEMENMVRSGKEEMESGSGSDIHHTHRGGFGFSNAELHKNMSKIAKAEAEVAGKAATMKKSSITLAQVLNGVQESKYLNEKKVMKKKPIITLVTYLFMFARKSGKAANSSVMSPLHTSSHMYWN